MLRYSLLFIPSGIRNCPKQVIVFMKELHGLRSEYILMIISVASNPEVSIFFPFCRILYTLLISTEGLVVTCSLYCKGFLRDFCGTWVVHMRL